jgi:acetyltransferase
MARTEAQQIGLLRLPDGARATVRPVCPRDAGRIQDYVRSLSVSSRYDRFLAAVNELSPAELDRIGRSDDRQATYMVETRIAGVRVVIGEVRYAAAPDGVNFEIALSLAENWRGRGLGARLMEFLECRACNLGVRTIVGDVLRSNAPMQKLARKAGFAMAGVPGDARLVRIVKDISDARVGTPCAQLMRSGLPIAA